MSTKKIKAKIYRAIGISGVLNPKPSLIAGQRYFILPNTAEAYDQMQAQGERAIAAMGFAVNNAEIVRRVLGSLGIKRSQK